MIYLVSLETDFDPEQWIRGRLSVSIDGLGQLLEGPLDVQSEGFLHHPVHLLQVTHPVLLHLSYNTNTMYYLGNIPIPTSLIKIIVNHIFNQENFICFQW